MAHARDGVGVHAEEWSAEDFFFRKGWQPFDFQREAWQAYGEGRSGLIHAPTGFGKTWAAYLGALAEARAEKGCAILWITPLRALAADTLRTLREVAGEVGRDVEARTGDTSAGLKKKLRASLPHTLVITPESLSLMLTHADTRERLAGLRCVIVDEWHELMGNKRGVQTELCLARLRKWVPGLRIWGLSATMGNLTEARRVLLGNDFEGSVEITCRENKPVFVDTVVPEEMERFPWAGHLGLGLAGEVVRAIESAGTTLVFTNTRSQTEIWFQELLERKPEWKGCIAMHHGSLDAAERRVAEEGLRDGGLRCVVATSSLDLGVDFSPVDQIIQIGSPKGVSRLMQRAGRSGHQPGRPSRVLGVPAHAFELVEFAAARDAIEAGRVEARPSPGKPLDVLVQHLVTCAIGEPFEPGEMRREVMGAHAYRALTDDEWQWALGFISTGGEVFARYPRYRKARVNEEGRYVVDDARLVRQHRFCIGTIVSDASVVLKFANGQALGTVEEGFAGRLKPGSVLVFGGRHLQLVRLKERVATVKVADKRVKGHVAVWNGSKMPLSSDLCHGVAARLRGEGRVCAEMERVEPVLELQRRWSKVPGDRELLVEWAASREGEHLFVYPMAGRLVHEGLAAVMAFRMTRECGEAIHTTANDYGFSLTASRGLALDEDRIRRALAVEGLLDDLLSCMNAAELVRRQFREVARVAGLIPQDPPGGRARGQRDLMASSSLLYEVLARYDPGNLLLEQARRDILERQLEMSRLRGCLDDLQSRPWVMVETGRLTPMAFPLWADRITALMPGGDAAYRLAAMLEELQRAAG